MDLMTVQQYAVHRDISVQAVYSLIKRNKVEWISQNGLKMVKVKVNTIKQSVVSNSIESKHYCNEILKPYKTIIKQLKKQIKKLENSEDKNYTRLEKLFEKVLEVKQLYTPAPIESNVIDVSDKNGLKNKKKSKRNKKKSKGKK